MLVSISGVIFQFVRGRSVGGPPHSGTLIAFRLEAHNQQN